MLFRYEYQNGVWVDLERPSEDELREIACEFSLSKQIEKLIENPEIGKPMRYNRKGTREVYISPYRLSYSYLKEKGIIYLLDLYHKDEQ